MKLTIVSTLIFLLLALLSISFSSVSPGRQGIDPSARPIATCLYWPDLPPQL